MRNVLDESVPYGKDDTGNLEMKKVGKTEKRKMKSHDEILGTRSSGFRPGCQGFRSEILLP